MDFSVRLLLIALNMFSTQPWSVPLTPPSPLSLQVEKLAQHPNRQQPPSNHWSWYQNVRPPGASGPPGPPPPARPMQGTGSPSQGPPALVQQQPQQGRRYGSSHPNSTPRSPTSSMLHNTGFPPAQVSGWGLGGWLVMGNTVV